MALGSRLVVFGGIEDASVVYGRGNVQVTLRVDGKRVGALDLPNLHETRLATFATEPLISTVELSLSTDKETDRRVCLDALILRWRSSATGPVVAKPPRSPGTCFGFGVVGIREDGIETRF